MNKKILLVCVLSMCCAVHSFAQGKLLRQVERAVGNSKFVPKHSLSRVVNGYLRTPNVQHFTLPNGLAMRAVRFSRNIAVQKENLLIPKGTLAVVDPELKITLFAPNETLPAEIQEGLNLAYHSQHPEFAEFEDIFSSVAFETQAEEPSAPWNGLPEYNAQTDLAKDIDAYYQGNADEVLNARRTGQEVKVYRVPSGDIYYQPVGRAGRYLNPNEDLVVFYPSQNDGQIIFGGVTDETWRMFFDPRP